MTPVRRPALAFPAVDRPAHDTADGFGDALGVAAQGPPRRQGWAALAVGGWLVSQVVGAVAFLVLNPLFVVAGTASGVAAAAALDDEVFALAAGTPLVALALLQAPVWATQLATVAAATAGRGRSLRRDLGLVVRPSDIGVGVACGVAAQLLIAVVYLLAGVDEDGPARQLTSKGAGTAGLIGMLLLLAVVAPIVEELLFRGLLQGGLAARMDARLALALTSVAFAAVHFQPVQFPGLVIAGLVFGGLALRAGRLGPAIVAHMAFNAFTVTLLALS